MPIPNKSWKTHKYRIIVALFILSIYQRIGEGGCDRISNVQEWVTCNLDIILQWGGVWKNGEYTWMSYVHGP